ncbi:hypothetical protein [Bradyrhizobium yuanmingense]|uniref:hypothetical protein n=1 Tax=Bradyrhizobium yuanmingense TaxID=108015 RepID=UPI003F6B5897
MAAAKVTFNFHLFRVGLDSGVAAQFVLDDTEDTVPLGLRPRTSGILLVVATVSLVAISPLDRIAGEYLGAEDVPKM